MAPTGKVTIQDMNIEPIILRFNADTPLANPTPKTAPTKVWVVDIGMPMAEARTTVKVAPISQQKPRL